MTTHSKVMQEAIDRVFDRWEKMSKEEFQQELDEHTKKCEADPNSLYWTLWYAWEPEAAQAAWEERFGSMEDTDVNSASTGTSD